MKAVESDLLVWKKARASESGDCVEVARSGEITLVRDSKDPSGPHLRFTQREWSAFLLGVRAGEFDLPT
jgi:predicted secreted Zn-dependent protease